MKKLARLASNILPTSAKSIIKRVANIAISAIPGEKSIELLGLKHATDKLSHGYLPYYDAHFSSIRHEKLKVLEIGIGGYGDLCGGGASLRLWQDYFANSHIYGLDIEDKSFHRDKRITTFQGSQNDISVLENVASTIGSIDIIIDDGSHINEHMILSFSALFPHLSQGGIYAIEDISTSYLPTYGGCVAAGACDSTAIGMVKSLIDGLNYQYIPGRAHKPFDAHVVSIHCYPKLVFIKKGVNKHILSNDEIALVNGRH
ncbi:MAG TPA: hypothetical protein VE988_08110 [Gemmataceae bacterium]|nr:hypothetical protein [Gemmataceae bacterium]